MHRLATVHARANQPTTNDITTQPISKVLQKLVITARCDAMHKRGLCCHAVSVCLSIQTRSIARPLCLDFNVLYHLRDFCTAPMATTCNKRTINLHMMMMMMIVTRRY